MIRRTTRRPTRIARALTGLAATIVMLAGLAGGPAVLIVLGRPLLPAHLPNWSTVVGALMHQDSTGHVFAMALLGLGSAAWLTFALSVIVELIARVSNRRTWHLPGLSLPQRWAATLVTSIALTFASPTAAALAGPVMPVTAVSTTVTVAHVDNAAPDQAVTVYQVHRGDYLGAIAERFEGDFGAYRQIAADNHIAKPSLIHTGDRIVLPDDAVDRGGRPHALGSVESTRAETARPRATPRATTKPHAVAGTTAKAHHTAPVSTHSHGTSGSAGESAAVAGTLAGLIAAGAVAIRHRETLQRRLVRRTEPTPPAPRSEPPRLMDPPRRGDLLRLDAALRVLADGLADWPVEHLPQIVGAYLDHGDITLMLAAGTIAPPEPFGALDNGWWTVAADAPLPSVASTLAPLPSLCTVGGRSEQHVLLDLEYLRVLTLAGDRAESLNLIRYLIADLCHNIWSDDLRVCIAGFHPVEAALLRRLDPARIRVLDSIPDALDRFSRRFDLGIDTWNRPDAAPPNDILFVADPAPADYPLIREFEQVLHEAPGVGLSVVVAPTDPAAAARYHAEVSETGILSLDWLGSKTPAASLPASLLGQVNIQVEQHRNSGDSCPLNISRAASMALRRSSANRPTRLSGQHRRPKGVPAQTWSPGVDLMRARHARPATA